MCRSLFSRLGIGDVEIERQVEIPRPHNWRTFCEVLKPGDIPDSAVGLRDREDRPSIALARAVHRRAGHLSIVRLRIVGDRTRPR